MTLLSVICIGIVALFFLIANGMMGGGACVSYCSLLLLLILSSV